MVKNLPCNAKDAGSIPGPGKSHMPKSNEAHVPQLLSLHSRAWEPELLSPRAQKPTTREATKMRSPLTAATAQPSPAATRESLLTAMKTGDSQINN